MTDADSSHCTCESAVMLAIDCSVHGEDVRALVVDAIDNNRLIMAQPPGRCDLCGAVEETRPYGPNGESICFGCGPGSSNPSAVAAAEAALRRRMGGTP